MTKELKSPYPYFGGKSKAAQAIWDAIGDVPNYIEPFFGSGAVLLARPHEIISQKEIVNDKDGFISNFWRAIQSDPEAVAYYADWPVSEIDLHARHAWLVNRKERLLWSLEDPDFYDAKIAGWWVWGMSIWIGGAFCSGNGKWASNGAHFFDRENLELPAFEKKRPTINWQGVTKKSLFNSESKNGLLDYFQLLSNRLRRVYVANGNWKRVIASYTLTEGQGITGVFLDPPYAYDAGRRKDLYAVDDGDISREVRQWAIEKGENPNFRIVLAGYEDEHEMPDNWRIIKWNAPSGYSTFRKNGENNNRRRERLWLSPHCLTNTQHALFGQDL
jgi:hypothetical protein